MISGAAALAAIWTYDVAVVLPVMQAIVVLLHRTEHRGTPQRLVGWAIAFGAWAVGDLWRELVLPRHFDAQLPSVLDALSKHFAAYWDLLLVTVQLRTLAALVAGMALMLITSRAAPGTPRLVRRLAAATSLAAVSYAPFVMFAGDSYRFYYSSLMYWILALALVLDYAGWAARGARLAFGAGCAALLVVSVYETGKFCQEWRVVSDTTRLMLEQVHAAVPEWPDRTDLVFIAVPDHYRRALAYLGYFEPMIAHTFGEVRGRVLMTETLDAASAVAEGRRRIVFEWVGFATGRGTAAGVRAVAASGL